jgi:hypothetical protein
MTRTALDDDHTYDEDGAWWRPSWRRRHYDHDDDDACNEDDANCHNYCTCLMELYEYIVNSVVGNLNTYQNFELLRLSHISVV